MKFSKSELFPHFECVISGIYKVVKYGDDKQPYHAYFKPHGWVNWGNSVAHTPRGTSTGFSTSKKAQKACEQHLETYPTRPNGSMRITLESH